MLLGELPESAGGRCQQALSKAQAIRRRLGGSGSADQCLASRSVAALYYEAAAFLTAYQQTGSRRAAAEAAAVEMAWHDRWIEEDPAYRQDFEAIQAELVDELQVEAMRRIRVSNSKEIS